jgi:two-component system response regulator YesN
MKMYQYNIVIADDEEIIRNGIKNNLLKEFANIKISGIYSNGEDAINHLKKEEADIIISDIAMPKKDGIAIAEYLRKKGAMTKMIFITGYRDFEYAKKLIDNQVSHLIVKPIDIDLLINTVKKLMDEIENERNLVFNETKQIILLHEFKRQNIKSIIFGEKKLEDIIFENKFDFYNYSCALVEIILQENKQQNTIKFNKIVWQDMGEMQTENIDIINIWGDSHKGIYYFINLNNDESDFKDNVFKYTINLCKDFETAFKIKCNYSYNFYKNISEIPAITKNDFIEIYIDYILNNDAEKRKIHIKKAVSNYDNVGFAKLVSDLLNRLNIQFEINYTYYKNKIDNAKNKEQFMAILNEIDNCFDNNALIDETNAIVKIIKYINEKYYEEITLDKISDIFGLSKSHISRIFKRKTGDNFVDYLNRLRIEKAKLFIEENKYSIGEIASKVGYLNQRYFGQVFKSVTGKTPSQYFISKIN